MMTRDKTGYIIFAVIVLVLIWSAIQASGQEPTTESTLEQRVERLEAAIERIHQSTAPEVVPSPEPTPIPEPIPPPPPVKPKAPYIGAEGYGAVTKGGRVEGSKELHVTRMDDPIDQASYIAKAWTPGTLRWAMMQPGPKKIIFDQPGVIRLQCPIFTLGGEMVKDMTFNETRQAVTVIGCFYLYDMAGAETVWLNTRFRGALWRNAFRPLGADGKEIGPGSSGDCLTLVKGGNTLIDHCEFSGGTDELLNYIYGLGHVTVQWCIFGDAFRNGDFNTTWNDEGSHHYGVLFNQYGEHGWTFHHNYFAHLSKRIPYQGAPLTPIAGKPDCAKWIETTNNVFYDWLVHPGGVNARNFAVVTGNTWRFGGSPQDKGGGVAVGGKCYLKDNLITGGWRGNTTPEGGTSNGFIYLTKLGTDPPVPLHEYPVTVHSQPVAISEVLDKAGVLPMDNLSKATRQSYRDGKSWQGAHPDWKAKTVDEYLTWATGVQ